MWKVMRLRQVSSYNCSKGEDCCLNELYNSGQNVPAIHHKHDKEVMFDISEPFLLQSETTATTYLTLLLVLVRKLAAVFWISCSFLADFSVRTCEDAAAVISATKDKHRKEFL